MVISYLQRDCVAYHLSIFSKIKFEHIISLKILYVVIEDAPTLTRWNFIYVYNYSSKTISRQITQYVIYVI
jgi:hypothetical protein